RIHSLTHPLTHSLTHSFYLFFLTDGVALSNEKRLIKHLLDNYERVGKVGRPVFNTTDTITVQYGLALIQILDLDEKNQVLTTNCWSRYVSRSSVGLRRMGEVI
ncbi:hypothetical protein LSH36_6g07005, partial [Paralvinella palmiformis]